MVSGAFYDYFLFITGTKHRAGEQNCKIFFTTGTENEEDNSEVQPLPTTPCQRSSHQRRHQPQRRRPRRRQCPRQLWRQHQRQQLQLPLIRTFQAILQVTWQKWSMRQCSLYLMCSVLPRSICLIRHLTLIRLLCTKTRRHIYKVRTNITVWTVVVDTEQLNFRQTTYRK